MSSDSLFGVSSGCICDHSGQCLKCSMVYDRARREALLEAAQVVENADAWMPNADIAAAIRALVDKEGRLKEIQRSMIEDVCEECSYTMGQHSPHCQLAGREE